MIPQQTTKNATNAPAKEPLVAAAMMQAITTITNIMLTHTSISHNDEDAAAIYIACVLMDQTTGLLKELVRDQLQPGTYGDAVLTATTRQARNIVNIPRIRELAAEVPDTDAWRKGDSDFEEHLSRYVLDHLMTNSKESKGESLCMDVYRVRSLS